MEYLCVSLLLASWVCWNLWSKTSEYCTRCLFPLDLGSWLQFPYEVLVSFLGVEGSHFRGIWSAKSLLGWREKSIGAALWSANRLFLHEVYLSPRRAHKYSFTFMRLLTGKTWMLVNSVLAKCAWLKGMGSLVGFFPSQFCPFSIPPGNPAKDHSHHNSWKRQWAALERCARAGSWWVLLGCVIPWEEGEHKKMRIFLSSYFLCHSHKL